LGSWGLHWGLSTFLGMEEAPELGVGHTGACLSHGWSGEAISTVSQPATTRPCPRPPRCFGSRGAAAHSAVPPPQTEYARLENGRFVYRIHRSPMCEYMINFIHKLKHLPEKYMMNSVLENFTILQVPPRPFQGSLSHRERGAHAHTHPASPAARPRGTQPWPCKFCA